MTPDWPSDTTRGTAFNKESMKDCRLLHQAAPAHSTKAPWSLSPLPCFASLYLFAESSVTILRRFFKALNLTVKVKARKDMCTYMCACVFVRMNMCVCVHVCVCACVCACVCECVHVCVLRAVKKITSQHLWPRKNSKLLIKIARKAVSKMCVKRGFSFGGVSRKILKT